ncbi:calvin cycle protein CP12-3, chloroplastic [Argentina anserina]|uniref:calvin cycle protein CP12-3, chloroplastic n=1 Tax=Argentina anserina TaxID=57926 RepID=UPI002176635B|nr:calvin cycle protein CP12-3, chloroplastic [Potentilla anserina]
MSSLSTPTLCTLRFSSNVRPSALASFAVRVVNPVGQRREVGMRVMAVAKFKGTQMREKKLTEMIEKKVLEAKEVCGEGNPITDECKVAWDEVEEVSQAKADLRLKLKDSDPLESYCEDNPETEECRIYED